MHLDSDETHNGLDERVYNCSHEFGSEQVGEVPLKSGTKSNESDPRSRSNRAELSFLVIPEFQTFLFESTISLSQTKRGNLHGFIPAPHPLNPVILKWLENVDRGLELSQITLGHQVNDLTHIEIEYVHLVLRLAKETRKKLSHERIDLATWIADYKRVVNDLNRWYTAKFYKNPALQNRYVCIAYMTSVCMLLIAEMEMFKGVGMAQNPKESLNQREREKRAAHLYEMLAKPTEAFLYLQKWPGDIKPFYPFLHLIRAEANAELEKLVDDKYKSQYVYASKRCLKYGFDNELQGANPEDFLESMLIARAGWLISDELKQKI